MAYLGDIVERLGQLLNTKITGSFDEKLKIDYIQFWPTNHKKEHLEALDSKGIVYIGGWNLHEKPREGCCAIISGSQAGADLPIGELLRHNVMCLDRPMDVMDVYETIQDELLSYVQFNEYKENMFNALQSGGGIRGIIHQAWSFLGNPVIVCDTSFSIIENYPEHENVLDFEFRNNKQYMRPESVMSMNKEGLIEQIFNDEHAFSVYRKELGMYLMYCSIRIGKNIAGYICVHENKRKFTKRDYEFVEVLSQMLSVEMQKSCFFAEKSGLKYEFFLTDLVEGNYVNLDDIQQRMAQLGCHNGKYHWIMALAFEDIYDGHISNEYYIEQLMTILRGGLATFYRGNILVLMTSDNRRELEDGELIKMQEFVTLNRMVMSVSFDYIKLNETPIYYEQAEQLLQYGKARGMRGRILKIGDYLCQTLIGSEYKLAGRQALIHPDLKFLMDYDEKNHMEYFKTLRTYLKCNRNVADAAMQLHIHKSSFFYRMNKLWELLNMEAGDCQRLFQYEVGMRIIEM